MALQDLNIMPSSRLGCPLSLKTPNMGNPGQNDQCPLKRERVTNDHCNAAKRSPPDCRPVFYNRSPIPTIGGKGYEKPFQARRMMYTTIALVGPLTHRSGGSIDEIHD